MSIFSFLKKMFFKSIKDNDFVVVDYTKDPYIPNGTVRMGMHSPLGTGSMDINLGFIRLDKLSPGQSVEEYCRAHPTMIACDAYVLDALLGRVQKENSIDFLKRAFGNNKAVIFSGTRFVTSEGVECLSYLNLSWRDRCLRYQIPTSSKVQEVSVSCYIALYEPYSDAEAVKIKTA